MFSVSSGHGERASVLRLRHCARWTTTT